MAIRTRKCLMENGSLGFAGWLLPFLSITLNSSGLYAAPGVPPFPVDQCPADRYTSKLNCTSNDVKFAGDPEARNPGTCSAGSKVVIPQLSVTVLPNSDIRYNLGLFFGEQGKDIQKLSTAGGNATCKAYTFPTSPAPWKDLDNNICGDVDGPSNPGTQVVTYEDVELSCVPGKDGDLLAPMLISWQQPGATAQCGTDSAPYPKSGNTYAVPGTAAKCHADTTKVVGNFTTYANLRIVKDANPDSPGPFTFTVAGESGGAATMQIFGSLPNPNPPTQISGFNLTGNAGSGDSQNLYVAYGGTYPTAKLTVTETGKSGYDLKNISCVLNDAYGNPTSTPATFISYNSIDGVLVANFDANNLSATCTYTNVQDPTVSGVVFRDNGGGSLAGKGDGIQQPAEPNINCNGPPCNCGSTCPPANLDALKNLYVIFLDNTNAVIAIAPVCPWNSVTCIPGSYTADVPAIAGLQLYVTNLANLPSLGHVVTVPAPALRKPVGWDFSKQSIGNSINTGSPGTGQTGPIDLSDGLPRIINFGLLDTQCVLPPG